MEIRSVNVLKFENGKVIMYPLKTIKDSGSYSIPPYIVKHNITYEEMVKHIKETLVFSGLELNPKFTSTSIFDKETIKVTGIKNLKMLHDKSLSIGLYTKDGQYHVSPTENLGYRRGFIYIDEKLSLDMDCSANEFAKALEKAFELSK